MKLERLFVPLKLVALPKYLTQKNETDLELIQRLTKPVGDYLSGHPRFSLLAKPGGGKSTLLKRLAVAYAAPERRGQTDDHLPEREWLPLFLRCRDLRDRAHRPIRALLDDLPQSVGMNGDESLMFHEHMDEALRSGKALLLIDGLDEISDEGARTTARSVSAGRPWS
jgi:predicted NACHT family NTPase